MTIRRIPITRHLVSGGDGERDSGVLLTTDTMAPKNWRNRDRCEETELRNATEPDGTSPYVSRHMTTVIIIVIDRDLLSID